MSDVTELDIPDYFPREELDKQEVSFHGRMTPVIKVFDGVEVEYSS